MDSNNRMRLWLDRLMRLSLLFGLAIVGWNGWLILQLATGHQPVQPLFVIQVVLQVGLGTALIAQAIAYRRNRGT